MEHTNIKNRNEINMSKTKREFEPEYTLKHHLNQILSVIQNEDLAWRIKDFGKGTLTVIGTKNRTIKIELEITKYIPKWFRLFSPDQDIILIEYSFQDKKVFKKLFDSILKKANSDYQTILKNIKFIKL